MPQYRQQQGNLKRYLHVKKPETTALHSCSFWLLPTFKQTLISPAFISSDFLHTNKIPKHNIVIGAVLPYIQAFLKRQEGNEVKSMP
jgi:hypothetical protein